MRVAAGLLGAGLGVALLWSAGCDRGAAPERAVPRVAADNAPLTVASTPHRMGAPPARSWKVAPILQQRAEAQRVIVEVADPLGEAFQPGGGETVAVAHRAARVAKRRADLAARKRVVFDALERALGQPPKVRYHYPSFRLFALDADAVMLRALEAIPEVTAVFADREEKAQLLESVPYTYADWFQQNRGSGQGTAVAVLDTPIRYGDAAFGSCPSVGAAGCSVLEWLSFADETSAEVIAAEDSYGKTSHGTNVAAIVLGVAPDTGLLGLNVFHPNDTEGDVRTFPSNQIEALDWVAQNGAAYDIVAVNMSIGATRDDPMPCNHDDPRYDPIRTLRTDHDILTVVSSGNSGEQNASKAPGCLTMAVTVAAQFDTDLGDYPKSCDQPDPYVGEIACFSNLTGMLDMIAPGVHVDAGSIVKSGTSMAAPHVAGAVAAWQSWYESDSGSFKSAPWMHRYLLADSTLPMVHSDGRRYARLAMHDESFQWDNAHAFATWHRESSSNAIPSAAPGFQQTIDVTGKGYDVASVYLYLEVVHLEPEDVEVTLESPAGTTATVTLPGGQAHFNGIIGRMIEPGAFTGLSGSPVDGTWTLSLRDTQAADRGNYIQATLFFVKDDCGPSCADEGCGDDRCGGSCGDGCVIDGACYLAGAPHPTDACWGCEPSVSATSWSPSPTGCDDGDPCTDGDACSAGECVGTPIVCPAPGPCDEPGICDSGTGTCAYPHAPDGVTCDDGDACTSLGTCAQGQCIAAGIDCPPPGECQAPGMCSSAEQQCVYAPVADGTPCSLGACQEGECRAPSTGGGCSCTTPPGSPSSNAPWALLLVGWAIARRRRGERA